MFEASNYTVDFENNRISAILKDNKNQYDFNDIDLYNLTGYTDTEYVQTMHDVYQVMIIDGEIDIHITEKIKNDILFAIECEDTAEIELKVNDGEWKKLEFASNGVSEIVIQLEELEQGVHNVIYLRSSQRTEEFVIKKISVKNIHSY